MRHALLALALFVPLLGLHGQDVGNLPSFEVASIKTPIAGQGPPPNPAPVPGPAFDVASIKPSRRDDTGWSFGAQPGGRWSMVNGSIGFLIREAYPAQAPELVGAPAWVTADRYDIIAKGEGNPTREQIRRMLQTLLAERFKLTVHYATEERPVFALVVASRDGRLGSGLFQSTLDCDAVNAARREGRKPEGPLPANGAPPCGMSLQARDSERLLFGGRPMSMLAEWLGQPSGRVVVDKTGLSGNYEFTLRYTSQLNLVDDAPSLFTALEEQLGLKLVPDRAPVHVLVVDHIERPTED